MQQHNASVWEKKNLTFPEHHPHFTPPLLASAFSVINTLPLHQSDPIAFMPVEVDTSGRIYDDFSRLQFLHDHREVSTLVNELPSVGECHDDLTYSF